MTDVLAPTKSKSARKTKRGNGEGSVYREASTGRWVGAISLNGKRHRVIGATRAEAAQRLAKLQEKVSKGLSVGDGNLTVAAWMEHWLVVVLPGRDPPRTRS
jgi:hypothetical protein